MWSHVNVLFRKTYCVAVSESELQSYYVLSSHTTVHCSYRTPKLPLYCYTLHSSILRPLYCNIVTVYNIIAHYTAHYYTILTTAVLLLYSLITPLYCVSTTLIHYWFDSCMLIQIYCHYILITLNCLYSALCVQTLTIAQITYAAVLQH